MTENKQEEKCSEDLENRRLSKLEVLFKVLPQIIVPLIISIAAAATLSNFFFKDSPFFMSRGKISETEKMYVYLSKGVEKGIFSEEYFNTAFNHFDRKSDGELTKYGRVETIEDFIVYLNSNQSEKGKINIDPVITLLEKIKEVEPFSALPAEERRLMDQLQLLVADKENLQPVIQTLNELKQVILARHKEYQRIEAQNAWSLPLAFIGVFLTLVFGIWTTILSFRQSRSRYRVIQREYVEHRPDGKIIRSVMS